MSPFAGLMQQELQRDLFHVARLEYPECNTDFNHRLEEIIMFLHVTFMSPMTVWKSPPSALHSLSITVSIFSGVNGNYKDSHSELLRSINEAAGYLTRAKCDSVSRGSDPRCRVPPAEGDQNTDRRRSTAGAQFPDKSHVCRRRRMLEQRGGR